MQRYNDLHLAVAIDRNKNGDGFQQEFVAFVRKANRQKTKQKPVFDKDSVPLRIWTEEDVKNMAQNLSITTKNASVAQFGCL